MTLSAYVALLPRLSIVAVVVVAFLLVYYPTFQKLAAHWAANDMYSYGFLVPIITGYLIWLRRARLRELPHVPCVGFGSLVLGGGLLMLVVGRISSTNVVEELSLPIAIGGLTLLTLGRQMTQSMAFPLAYLFMMIPFWDFLTNRLHLPFQLYSATMGVGALRLFNIPVLREGVLIYLPNITLEVADVCSGVNNLVAVLCIGVPLTHFHVRGWPSRLFILASAVLFALLSNGARVAMVSLFAFYGIRGADGDVHGPYSLLRSLLISGVGFVALFWLIAKFADRPQTQGSMPSNDPAPPRSSPTAIRVIAVTVAIMLMASVLAFERWHRVTPIPLQAPLAGFPSTIGRWSLVSSTAGPRFLDQAGFDRVLSRSYAAPDGSKLDLLVGYYERQQQGRELVGFEVAQIIPRADARFRFRSRNGASVADFMVREQGKASYVTTWYVLNGRETSADYQVKWWTAWDALTAGRSNGGIVMVRMEMHDGEPVETARSRVLDFVEGVRAASGNYFPS
jgi:EpsI family protein